MLVIMMSPSICDTKPKMTATWEQKRRKVKHQEMEGKAEKAP